MFNDKPLLGHRILIVEDDYYQARDIEKLLLFAGAQIVATGAREPDLASLLRQGRIDAGLIDINLGHGLSFVFARAVRDHAIPFVILTGYHPSVVPEDLASAPCLRKPAATKRIVEELSILVARPD